MLNVFVEKLGDVHVLHIQGRIVYGVATTTLREAVVAQANASAVVLDLAQVVLIDAGGLGALLELREWTQSKGIEFRLKNIRRLVKQVFEITRLDSVFEISPLESVSGAAASARPPALMKTFRTFCCES
jgi:anti-sigma B factor antagonist